MNWRQWAGHVITFSHMCLCAFNYFCVKIKLLFKNQNFTEVLTICFMFTYRMLGKCCMASLE